MPSVHRPILPIYRVIAAIYHPPHLQSVSAAACVNEVQLRVPAIGVEMQTLQTFRLYEHTVVIGSEPLAGLLPKNATYQD